MKNKYKSFIAAVLLFSMLLSLGFANFASAASSQKYLSLGDSIAAGYGLKTPETEKYAKLVTNYLSKQGTSYELADFAVSGMDSSDLLKTLSDMSNKELISALQTSSVITVSIGGNNFLKPLMSVFSTENMSNINTGNVSINPEQINESMITFFLNALFDPAAKEYKDILAAIDKGYESFKSDIDKIIEIINKNKNANAKVVFFTVYSPYREFASKSKNFNDTAELYINKINDVIKEKSKNNYIICDVYTSFKNANQRVVNANLNGTNSNIDPHPNVAGHKLIYRNIINSLGYSVNFDDMGNTAWAVEYVDGLYDLSIMFGTNSQKREFSPNLELKNCDLAVLLVRALKLKINDSDVADIILPFSDTNKIPEYALNSVKACYKAGLYNQLYPNGKTYEFAPQKSARRIDVALMVVELINKTKWSKSKPVYTDLKGVSEEYYPALSTLYEYEIMVGMPDKTLKPFDGLTRAQVAKIIWTILSNDELTE